MSGEFLVSFRNIQNFWGAEKQSICSWKTDALGPDEQMQIEFSVAQNEGNSVSLAKIYLIKAPQFGLLLF